MGGRDREEERLGGRRGSLKRRSGAAGQVFLLLYPVKSRSHWKLTNGLFRLPASLPAARMVANMISIRAVLAWCCLAQLVLLPHKGNAALHGLLVDLLFCAMSK